MKKFLCVLIVIFILMIGSVSALADPYGKPNTEDPTSVYPPIITSMLWGK